ncbi:MAG: hypothetical protein JRM77_05175 [Nitrososphaerota archaeon]|jgi:hypothetical protein|nr:hypothetical protein [Nitrososphaerota archaeon]
MEALNASDINYRIILVVRGKPSALFDELVAKFLDGVTDVGIIPLTERDKLRKEGMNVSPDVSSFNLGFDFNSLPNEKRPLLDQVKKKIQREIQEKGKDNEIMMFARFEYPLRCTDKTMTPIDIMPVVFTLGKEIRGMSANINESNAPDLKRHLMEAAIESFAIPWVISIHFIYRPPMIDGSFYENVRRLSGYLMKIGLLVSPLDEADIIKRYSEAVEDVTQQYCRRVNLAETGNKYGKSAEEVRLEVRNLVENIIPKEYLFVLDLKAINWREFAKIQGELFDNLRVFGYPYTFNVVFLSTEIMTPVGYGCYIQTGPERLKQSTGS